MSESIRGRVLNYIRRYGHPVLPLPDETAGTEAYRREEARRRVLMATRIDEMADNLCLPTSYLLRVLIDLEDSGVVNWRTGKIVADATAQPRRPRVATRLG